MKTYFSPEWETIHLPQPSTVEIGASWPWGDIDPDETEII